MGDVSRAQHLGSLLTDYPAETEREGVFLRQMSRLLTVGEQAFARDHLVPGHFTASAFVLDPEQRALLLILHAKLGMWLQPGGHIEPDDRDVVAAARRELREEVGLGDANLLQASLFDIDVHDIPAFGATPPHQHFDLRFAFVAPRRSVVAASDARDARWVPLPEVARFHTDASVMRAVERLRRRLAG
jgi:8-oxo-dGTP pyrophosphatase MutT (NUDIX family)